MRVAGYIRVSTEEQREEGFSLAAQEQQIRAFCKGRRWQLVRVFSDEGLSGKDLKRPALEELLSACRHHEFDVVLVTKLDRLSRNTRHILGLVEDAFSDNGVRLVSIAEGIDATTAAGEFVLTVLAGLAQMERKQIGERTRVSMAEGRRQGKHMGRPPFGWRLETSSGELVPCAEEQKELRRARRLARRHGYNEAARRVGWAVPTLWYRLAGRKQRARRVATASG